MKSYKRNSTIYKNTTDCPKLSKKLRRVFEKSNRAQSKSEIRSMDMEETKEDDGYELEMELSWLCYQAEKAVGEGYECACPINTNTEEARDHFFYLQNIILTANMKEEK